VLKPSEQIPTDAKLHASAAALCFRGGIKLAAALDHFGFNPKDRICLDIGASTGGFTQVLLDRGARRIYAVDVGTDQLHKSLRTRPEVVSFDSSDIRTISRDRLGELPDLVSIDVSFISLKLTLPALGSQVCGTTGGADQTPIRGGSCCEKGIVRDTALQEAICDGRWVRDVVGLACARGYPLTLHGRRRRRRGSARGDT
jgi:23S rRNA (cytidine1920-2'-O)/16S rRNA (cytidine1409-2'-O)-methyltransferase